MMPRRLPLLRRILLAFGAVLLLVGGAFLAADWWICLPEGKTADYVGRKECLRCHQKEFDLWKGSDHDLAMDRATPETVLGDFEQRQFTHFALENIPKLSAGDFRTVIQKVEPAQWAMALKNLGKPLQESILQKMPEEVSARVTRESLNLESLRPCDATQAQDEIVQLIRHLKEAGEITVDLGVTSRLFRRGEKFYVTTDGPTGEMETFEIKYTFGVRPLQQYLVEFPDGRVQCLPIAWDTEKKRWFHLYPAETIPARDELHWTGPLQNWNYMCAECHSTHLEKKYELPENRYHSTWSEIDVSCESCHGPGSLHVELADSYGIFWDRRIGYGLPRLKAEDPRVEIETCAPCHSRRRVIYPGHQAGEKFLDFYLPELLDRNLYYADGQILEEDYVYGSFLQSRMYREKVRCTDCHDPHTARVKFNDNRLCGQCHLPATYDTVKHHHHPDASKPGTRCVQCHMPETTYMVVDPRRDHSLRVPRPDLTVSLGIPNACNGCHHDRSQGETPAWADEQVQEWYGKHQGPKHFAYALADGRKGKPEAEEALEALTRRRDLSGMVRASALILLGEYATETGRTAAFRSLKDPDELVRAAAVRSLQHLHPGELRAVREVLRVQDELRRIERLDDPQQQKRLLRQLGLPLDQLRRIAQIEDLFEVAPTLQTCFRRLGPMLSDPIRAVRTEAARILSRLPRQVFSAEDRQAFDAALAEFLTGQESLSDRPGAHLQLGIVYANLNEHHKAEREYQTGLRIDSRFLPLRINLAMLYGQQRKRTQAEKQFRQSIELVKNRTAEARRHLRDTEELEQAMAEVRYSLGLLLAEDEKQFAEAAEELAEAVRLAPDNPRMRYNFGLVLQYLDKNEEAEKEFSAARKLAPAAFDYLNALAHLYAKQKRWARAIQCAEQGLQERPRDRQRQALLEYIKRESQQDDR